MNRNKVKIQCNPYSKKIAYYWWDGEEEDWKEVSTASQLSCEEYTNATIQNKVNDIIAEVNKSYNVGNVGLDIVFEGTDDDFNDVENVVECYFEKCNISCIKGEKYVYTAAEVMPQIEEIFSGMKTLFEQYPDKDIENEINRFNDAVKPTISICVIGLYSSGKSAFINSLIGEEILPSASDPTTAKNYKVMVGDNAEIHFIFNGEDIILRFKDKEYHPNKTAELGVLADLQKIVFNNDGSSQNEHMYRALEVINNYDKEHKTDSVSDLIEIIVPFKNSTLPIERYNFVIYDTPGSDPASNDKHKKVLKNSLMGQTNGLPIFVTEPDSMDKQSNDEIIDLIDDLGDALDRTNTMIVVNKSDEKENKDLVIKKEKCKELRITKWKSTRIYFVSSIIGLGSKKEFPMDKGSWIDKTYFKVYKKQSDSFSDPDDDFYMQLYKYNLMPQYQYEKYCEAANVINDEIALTSYNSGMHCVEREISEFANKYALYNKCKKATDYLNSAVDLIVEKIAGYEKEQDKIQADIQSRMDKKKTDLIEELNNKGNSLEAAFNKQYVDMMTMLISQLFSPDLETKKIQQTWEECKNNNKKNSISKMKSEVNKIFNAFLVEFYRMASSNSEKFWSEKQTEYKKSCCKIVAESSVLTDEQKKFLEQFVLSIEPMTFSNIYFDIKKIGAITPKQFLFIKWGEKFRLKPCISGYNEELKLTLTTMNQRTIDNRKADFAKWKRNLIIGLQQKIGSFNPELASLIQELGKCQKKISSLDAQRQFIMGCCLKIDDLMEYREMNENE